jgi:hypothetical protein
MAQHQSSQATIKLIEASLAMVGQSLHCRCKDNWA